MSEKIKKLKKEDQKSIVDFWLRDDGIIEFKIAGTFDKKMAQEILKKMDEEKKFIEKTPNNVRIFCDLSQFTIKIEEGWSSSVEARRVGIETLKWDKIEKIVVVGRKGDILFKVGALTVIRFLDPKKAKYFTNKKEAIEWLKK